MRWTAPLCYFGLHRREFVRIERLDWGMYRVTQCIWCGSERYRAAKPSFWRMTR